MVGFRVFKDIQDGTVANTATPYISVMILLLPLKPISMCGCSVPAVQYQPDSLCQRLQITLTE